MKVSSQKDQISAFIEKYPELKDRGITPDSPITKVLDEISALLEEKDKRLEEESEPTALLSAHVPKTLKERVSSVAKNNSGLTMRQIIIESLYDYLYKHPELLPEDYNKESKKEDSTQNKVEDNKNTKK